MSTDYILGLSFGLNVRQFEGMFSKLLKWSSAFHGVSIRDNPKLQWLAKKFHRIWPNSYSCFTLKLSQLNAEDFKGMDCIFFLWL